MFVTALFSRIAQELGENTDSPLFDRVIIGENNKTDKLIVVRDPRRLNASLLLINEMFTKIDSIGSRITNFGDKVGVISDNKLKVEPELAIKNVNKLNNFVEDISQKRIKFKNKWKGTKDE